MEGISGIETVSVEQQYASQVVADICIDIAIGSFVVQCSNTCSSPCGFGSKGIRAGQLIRLGEKWHRVSSHHDGVQESFEIASVDDSSIKMPYIGESSLVGEDLQVWTGGYEWVVTLRSTFGEVKYFSTTSHHMLPPEAAVEITNEDCDKCIYVDNLSKGAQYYVRAQVKNDRGWSAYTDAISETPRAIPSAPQIFM